MKIKIGKVFNKVLALEIHTRKDTAAVVRPDTVYWGKDKISLGTNLNLRQLNALPNNYRRATEKDWEQFVKEAFTAVF